MSQMQCNQADVTTECMASEDARRRYFDEEDPANLLFEKTTAEIN